MKHERDPLLFGKRSDRVFGQRHSLGDELDWLDAEGPTSPALIDYVAGHAADYDYCLFFSYRYYHAYYGARAAGARAILVPTAERDATIGLSIFQPLFRGVRAVMYNSPEERAMIQAVSANHDVPGVVVGIGSDVPSNPQPQRFRQKYNIRGPFAVYVGRIDQNKGCTELFEFFQGYLKDRAGQAVARADRQLAAADPRTPADSPSGIPRRHGQVRRDGGRGSAGHAVVLREPVDGHARSVGARPAGAGQRQVRRAQGPVHPQQRRPLLRDAMPSSSSTLEAIEREPLADRHARPQRAAVLSATTTTGRSSSASTSTCSSA